MVKLVSNGWQFIIDSLTFYNFQFITNLNQNDIIIKISFILNGFIITTLETIKYNTFDLKQMSHEFSNPSTSSTHILGVNNGLVLLEFFSKIGRNFLRQYILYNPATKQIIELPQLGSGLVI